MCFDLLTNVYYEFFSFNQKHAAWPVEAIDSYEPNLWFLNKTIQQDQRRLIHKQLLWASSFNKYLQKITCLMNASLNWMQGGNVSQKHHKRK